MCYQYLHLNLISWIYFCLLHIIFLNYMYNIIWHIWIWCWWLICFLVVLFSLHFNVSHIFSLRTGHHLLERSIVNRYCIWQYFPFATFLVQSMWSSNLELGLRVFFAFLVILSHYNTGFSYLWWYLVFSVGDGLLGEYFVSWWLLSFLL